MNTEWFLRDPEIGSSITLVDGEWTTAIAAADVFVVTNWGLYVEGFVDKVIGLAGLEAVGEVGSARVVGSKLVAIGGLQANGQVGPVGLLIQSGRLVILAGLQADGGLGAIQVFDVGSVRHLTWDDL